MGYYVQIVQSNYTIPGIYADAAYKAMCALNTTHDDQKMGGSFSGGKQTAKWFSWMDENYPETCADAQAIFEALGFEVEKLDDGSLVLESYDSKTGQEDLFLEAIQPFALPGTGILWRGEDGMEYWTLASAPGTPAPFAGEYTVVPPAEITA